jgi:pyruvate carboxylase
LLGAAASPESGGSGARGFARSGHPRALAEAAVTLARAAGYYNAGTVEFLVDADSGDWYFIEVNPRIQVEHTVTEMVTGIDLVRCQIQVAQGLALHGAEMNLPAQPQIPLYGYALQCRITTEDPANGFVPDYGKLSTYRSRRPASASGWTAARLFGRGDHAVLRLAAGEDHRLGREFATPASAWTAACASSVCAASRPTFRSWKTWSTTPISRPAGRPRAGSRKRPRCSASRRGATAPPRILSYLGDVIVNGNPTVAGKAPPARLAPRRAAHVASAPPDGTRQLLSGSARRASPNGPFAKKACCSPTPLSATPINRCWPRASAPTTCWRSPISYRTACTSLYSLEMWGGATFDVTMRFLHEDPFVRLRQLRQAIPNICFQMLLRASNAVGYTAYPDNVVAAFIQEAAAQGIDIFRIFDSLNWLPNMKASMEAVRKTSSVCEAAVCYTGDILDPRATSIRWNTMSAWPRSWSAWAPTFWPSKTWRAW